MSYIESHPLKRGGRSYRIVTRVDGLEVKSAWIRTTRAAAETMLREWEAQVQRARLGLGPAPAAKSCTVAELAERYLREVSAPRGKARSHAECEKTIRTRILGAPEFRRLPQSAPGDLPLILVDASRIETWRTRLRRSGVRKKTGLTPATCNRALSAVSALLTAAVRWNLIAHNPARQVPRLKETPPRFDWLRPNELDALLDAAVPPARELLATLAWTGLRWSEAVNLRRGDVDLERAELHVRAEIAKNDKARRVPLSTQQLALLRQLIDASPTAAGDALVFPSPATGRPWVDIRAPLHAALAAAGLRRIHPHVLRHTFASHWVLGGGSLLALKEILGHATLSMVQRYAHLDNAALRSEMARVQTRLAELATPDQLQELRS